MRHNSVLRFLLPLLFCFSVLAQGTASIQFTQSFTTATSGSAIPNDPTVSGGPQGSVAFRLVYYIQPGSGTVSALSVELDGAATSGGSYSALTPAVGGGSGSGSTLNPVTTFPRGQNVLCCDFYPFLKIKVNTLTVSTGTPVLIVKVLGYAGTSAAASGAGGGGGPAVAIGCVGTPGNTMASYRQQCQTSAGSIWTCNNGTGCSVASDWAAGAGPVVCTAAQQCTMATTLPMNAPADSIAGAGNAYFADLTLDSTLANYFTGQSGSNFCQPQGNCTHPTITGSGDIAGGRALWSVTSGFNDTAYGIDALGFVDTGHENAGFGSDALAWASSGYYNQAMGMNTLWSVTTGYANTGTGFNGGFSPTTGHYNTFDGAFADLMTPNPTAAGTTFTPTAGSGLAVGSYFYGFTFVLTDPAGSGFETDISAGGYFGAATTNGNQHITIANIPTYSGPLTCTARKLYRTPVSLAGASGPARHWYALATLADNTTTGYVDSTPDGSLGAENVGPNGTLSLGAFASPYKSNQAVMGAPAAPISELWFNGVYGAGNTTIYPIQISSAGAIGSNLAGANLTLQGGPGTGTGAGGTLILRTFPAGSSGSTWNTVNPYQFTLLPGNGILQNYNSGSGTATQFSMVNSASTTYNGNGSATLKATRQSDGSTNFDLLLAPGSAGTQQAVLSLVGGVTVASRASKATCWKADGHTLGYCSTQPDSGGSCTCN